MGETWSKDFDMQACGVEELNEVGSLEKIVSAFLRDFLGRVILG